MAAGVRPNERAQPLALGYPSEEHDNDKLASPGSGFVLPVCRIVELNNLLPLKSSSGDEKPRNVWRGWRAVAGRTW